MSSKVIPIVLAGSLALGGCASTYSPAVGEIDPADFGEANRQTYAAMIIDPDPQYDEPLATSAEHASDAIERYREGNVEEPDTVSTTSGSGSGGGGGS